MRYFGTIALRRIASAVLVHHLSLQSHTRSSLVHRRVFASRRCTQSLAMASRVRDAHLSCRNLYNIDIGIPLASISRKFHDLGQSHGFSVALDGAEVSAAAYKSNMAEVWSEGAGDYCANVHEGAQLMMPLVRHFVSLVEQKAGATGPLMVLDIASGSGEPALSIARSLPNAQVTATDLAPGMVAQAASREQDIGNFRAVVADGEDLSAFKDGSVDVVTCCQGLMALAEWRRVLKPSGALITAVWGSPAEVQLAQIMVAVAKGIAPRGEMMSNPSVFGDPTDLVRDIAAAGFAGVEDKVFNVPMVISTSSTDVVVRNPMIAGLVRQVVAEGHSRYEVEKEAEKLLFETARERNLLTPDGAINCRTNAAIVITATAA